MIFFKCQIYTKMIHFFDAFQKKSTKRPRKVCFVITSKIHYSRSKLILTELKKRQEREKDVELQIVVAASALIKRYGDVEGLMKRDGFIIHGRITMFLEGGNTIAMAKTTGLGIIEFSSVFDNLNPDIIVIRGDRYEVLSAALAGAFMNKTIAHIEGGDVSGSIDESVRHAITKLSHVHFVSNEESRDRVIRMGENKKFVYNVGASDVEFASLVTKTITNSDINKFGEGAEIDIDAPFLLLIQHPVTTDEKNNKANIEETLIALDELRMPTIVIWSNNDAGADEVKDSITEWRKEKTVDKYMRFISYIDPESFINLLTKTVCLVGNSSSGIKECSYLGVPVVNIGDRQNGRLKDNNVIDVPSLSSAIVNAIKVQIKNGSYPRSSLYHKKDSSKTIARILSKVDLYTQKTFIKN